MGYKYTYWTDEKISAEALKFTTRGSFAIGNKAAYQAAYKRGILEEVCSHMEPILTYWTEEMIAEAALQFDTRVEFGISNPNAYTAAKTRGIMDQICLHMRRGKSGFDPNKPCQFYVVRLDNPKQSYIGFGISTRLNGRMRDHIRNVKAEGFSLTILQVLDFQKGKDAYRLERKLKEELPITTAGVTGFRTEAILASDYDKLKETINANQNLCSSN
jgi:hypothetical protein